MLHNRRTFTVAIYADEYKQMCAWVLKNKTLETGGDLFGLWSEDGTAVIQLVLGPGQGCRREVHSFYQDVPYLQRVGNHLTGEEGLCHIGEWHSHHTIGLRRPSGGDEGTVWRNMPTYDLNRFILFIANIGGHSYDEVSVGCFLFQFKGDTRKKLPVLQGKFQLLPKASPFRSKLQRTDVLKQGAEDINQEREIANLYQISTNERDKDQMRPLMALQQVRRQTSKNDMVMNCSIGGTEHKITNEKRKSRKKKRTRPTATQSRSDEVLILEKGEEEEEEEDSEETRLGCTRRLLKRLCPSCIAGFL